MSSSPICRIETDTSRRPPLPTDLSLKRNVDRVVGAVERELIIAALEKSGGNKDRAARILNISRRSLFYKLKQYGIN